MSDDVETGPGAKPDEGAHQARGKASGKASGKMGCEEVQENLDAYLDGELAADLAAEEVAAFKAHLFSCEECLARLERRKTLVGLLQSAPRPKAPAGLAQKILAETSRASRPERPKPIVRLRTWIPALAAAAVVLLAAVIGLNVTRGQRAPDRYVPTRAVHEARAPEALPGVPAEKADAEARPKDATRISLLEERRRRRADLRVLGKAGPGEAPREMAAREVMAREEAPRPAAPPIASDAAKVPGLVMKKAERASAPAASAARNEGEPLQAAADAARFEKKARPRRGPTGKRSVTSKDAAPAGARRKSARPGHLARSAWKATGERYRPGAAEQILGERESFDEELGQIRAGRSRAIPQILRIPRQTATGRGGSPGEQERVLTSRVTVVRAGEGLDVTIPLVTSRPVVTQTRLVRTARELGGELVEGFSAEGAGPEGAEPALALPGVPGRRPEERAAQAEQEAVTNVPSSSVEPHELKVVVRIPRGRWHAFFSLVGLAASQRDAPGQRGGTRGGAFYMPPLDEEDLREDGTAVATVQFPLISPEELAAEIKASKAAAVSADRQADAVEAEAGAEQPLAEPALPAPNKQTGTR